MNRSRTMLAALVVGAALSSLALGQSQPPAGSQPPTGVDPATHAAHVAQGAGAHSPPTGQPVDNTELARQLAELRAQIAQLQAALAQGQAAGGSPQPMPQGGMKQGMPMGGSSMQGMGMSRMGGGSMPQGNSGMSGMSGGSGGRGMMDMDKMMMGGMSGGGGGMSMDGMMKMMGMGDMPMGGAGSPATMAMPSALPGFPGASHIYHVGATGFFLDHPEHITLTLEQQAALSQMKEQALLQQAEFQRGIEQAEQELWVLTAADQPDAVAIEHKVQEVARKQGEQRLAFIRAVGEAAKALTDEQRKQLTGMLPPAPTPMSPAAPAMPPGGMSDM